MGFVDREPAIVIARKGLLRLNVINANPREPRVEGEWPRYLDKATIVVHADKGDVCEHPDERFRIVTIQSRNSLLESTTEHVECHKRNGASSIAVRRRKFVPRGQIVIVENSLRLAGDRGAVHQVVKTDIAMMDPVDPETVVAWGLC